MNWLDIKRSLDSEIARLEQERLNQMKQDEKLAEFLLESDPNEWRGTEVDSYIPQLMQVPTLETCTSCNGLRYHPPFTFDQNQEAPIPCGKCNNVNHKKLATVVKGSSVNEFKQNWKDKVEAN